MNIKQQLGMTKKRATDIALEYLRQRNVQQWYREHFDTDKISDGLCVPVQFDIGNVYPNARLWIQFHQETSDSPAGWFHCYKCAVVSTGTEPTEKDYEYSDQRLDASNLAWTIMDACEGYEFHTAFRRVYVGEYALSHEELE